MTRFQLFLGTILIFAGGFFIAQNYAKATFSSSQVNGAFISSSTNTSLYFLQSDGSSALVKSGTNYTAAIYASSSALSYIGPMTTINKVSFLYQRTDTTADTHFAISMYCTSNGQTTLSDYSSQNLENDLVIHSIQVNLSPSFICNTATNPTSFVELLIRITLVQEGYGHLGGAKIAGTDSNIISGMGWADDYNYTGFQQQYLPIFNINGTLVYTGATSTWEGYITPDCGPTSWTILGADFGKGFCDVAKFLFYPPDTIVGYFQSSYENLQTKIPFSYAFEVINIVQNATSTAQSLPTIAIQTSSTSSIPNMNIALFSSSTLSDATSRTGFSGLRTLANILLYVGFGMMCYYTGVSLIGKKE
jgi:hypothetical protein